MHRTDKIFENKVLKLWVACTAQVDLKIKFRLSILDLSRIAEEGFALRHCLLLDLTGPFHLKMEGLFEIFKFSMLSVHIWLILYEMGQTVFILSFLPGVAH